MGFFDVPPTPEPEPHERHRSPAWFGPPENMLGGVATLRVVLARTERVAVAAIGASAYPEGVRFDVVVRARPGPDAEADLFDPFGHHQRHRRRRDEPWPPPDVLRFGVAWARPHERGLDVEVRELPDSTPAVQVRELSV